MITVFGAHFAYKWPDSVGIDRDSGPLPAVMENAPLGCGSHKEYQHPECPQPYR